MTVASALQSRRQTLDRAIAYAGGQHSVALICGVKQPTVWYWAKKSPHGIPRKYAESLAAAILQQVTARAMRPDIDFDARVKKRAPTRKRKKARPS